MINVKLQQIRYFVSVFEEGSFTAAAKRMNATQSGLSVQIKDLEHALNIKLFDRNSTGVVPTTAGEKTYKRAIKILREVSSLETDIEALRGRISGNVSIGVMPTFARAVLAPALERFLSTHPLVNVQVFEAYSAVLCDEIASGNLDFAMVPGEVFPTGIRSSHIATDVEVLVRSAKHNHSHLKPVSLAKIDPLDLVLPGINNARRAKLIGHLQTNGISTNSTMDLDSMMTTLDLIRRGKWAAILPGCLCLPDLETSDLEIRPLIDPPLTSEYYLIESAAQQKSVAAMILAEMVVEEINSGIQVFRDAAGL